VGLCVKLQGGGRDGACGTSLVAGPRGRSAEEAVSPAEERMIIWSSEKESMVDA
jgi:hypothetical protein